MAIRCNECHAELREPVDGWAECTACGRRWQIENGAIREITLVVQNMNHKIGEQIRR